MSTTVITTHVSESRTLPRIWLEGTKLAHAGVVIGVQYILNVSTKLRRIELRPAPADYAGKTINVSKRTRNDRVLPLLELRDAMIAEIFEIGTKLRVAIQHGRIVISLSHTAQRIKERTDRFLNKLKNGLPLETVSLFHGGGVLDLAIHKGLQRQQMDSFVKVGVELEADYLDASVRNNTELWRSESIAICSDIREVNVLGAGIPQADMCVLGLPCTGASLAGRAKLHLSAAEEHPSAGALFIDFLNWVKAANPAIVVLENVPEFSASQSMTVIRSTLTHMGYDLSETVLDGAEMGALEKRKRLCMIATTPGICSPVNFDNLVPVRQKEASLSEIMEDVPADSDSWKSYSYLAEKEVRDIAAGKGFRRQLLTGDSDGCGCLGRGYSKARSCEPFIVAPHDQNLSRLLTPVEHARVKTIPESLIEGLSATVAHEVLGQSVVFAAFQAVGELIAKTIKGLVPSFIAAPAATSDAQPSTEPTEFALTA